MNYTFKHISKYKLSLLNYLQRRCNVNKNDIVTVKKCSNFDVKQYKFYRVLYNSAEHQRNLTVFILENALNSFELMHCADKSRAYECVTCIKNITNACDCVCAD